MILHSYLNIDKDVVSSSRTVFCVKALFLSLVIALSAQISIPFWPVPLTLQPLMISVIGFSCQPLMAISAVAAYTLEGAIGLPVFQGLAGGFHHILGPTGGYIIGFLPSVAITSYFKGNGSNPVWLLIVGLLARVPLYVLGVLWLSRFIGFNDAIKLGFLPFLLKIPIEAVFAVLTCRLLKTGSQWFERK